MPSGDVAITAGPNYAIAASNRTSAYENKRDDDRVIQEVNQTIKGNNAPAMASLNHANLLYGTANYDRAIPYYDQALKLQPGNRRSAELSLRRAGDGRRAQGRAGGLQRGAPPQAEQPQRARSSRPGLSQARPAGRGHRRLRRGAQAQPEFAGGVVRARRCQADEGRHLRQHRRPGRGAGEEAEHRGRVRQGRRARPADQQQY